MKEKEKPFARTMFIKNRENNLSHWVFTIQNSCFLLTSHTKEHASVLFFSYFFPSFLHSM